MDTSKENKCPENFICCKEWDPTIEGPCCFDRPKLNAQQLKELTFEEYLSEARDEFCEFIWAHHSQSIKTRVAAENILIAYDQMREVIKNMHQ